MLSREFCGILMLAATGLCVTGDMVTSKLIEASKWPYWYLVAGSCLVASICNGLAVYWFRWELPTRADLKWVISRSLLEDLHWYLAVVAVIIGASPGDVAALTSIDIIAAALFGLIFLGEKLTIWHFAALTLSVAGAICISQPEFIFGFPEGKHHSPVGYIMALLSGCFQAGSFVCARKSAHLSIGVLTFSSLLLAVPMALVPPLLPMGHHATFEPLAEEPWTAMGLLVLISLWTMSAVALPAAGATRCPAAVSATVFTSACMVSGYLAQMIFFKEIPQALTLIGAGCMLVSVVIMAMPSTEPSTETETEEKAAAAPSAASVAATEEAQAPSTEDDETMSLGSFVASEVSFCSSSVRHRWSRRRLTQPEVLAQSIGAAWPVVSMSA